MKQKSDWLIIVGLIGVLMICGWVMNIYKLTQLDFEEPYKAEVIRTISIVPIIGGITGWFDIGEEDK